MKLTNIKHFLSTFVRENNWWGARPQREIFSGGTKVGTGPPKSLRVPNLRKILLIFCPKLGEEQKKRSSLKFSPIFCLEFSEEQKKKSLQLNLVQQIRHWERHQNLTRKPELFRAP